MLILSKAPVCRTLVATLSRHGHAAFPSPRLTCAAQMTYFAQRVVCITVTVGASRARTGAVAPSIRTQRPSAEPLRSPFSAARRTPCIVIRRALWYIEIGPLRQDVSDVAVQGRLHAGIGHRILRGPFLMPLFLLHAPAAAHQGSHLADALQRERRLA